ncbi:MAG: hypothetical protein V8Q71_00140 [Bacilli bacterium]
MNKEMYFYSRKYPEHKIEKIIVNSEELLVWKDYKRISGVYTNYDIGFYISSKDEHYISLCKPYEDDEIYSHNNTLGNELIFSYNQELINEWRNEDIKLEIHKLERRLKALKGE